MTENEKIELFDKWYDENYDEWAEGEEGIALREELEQAFKGGVEVLEAENAELKSDNDARKFAMAMSEKVEKQLREEIAELRKVAEFQQSSNMNRYFENKKLKEGLAVGSTFNKALNSMNKNLEEERDKYRDMVFDLQKENAELKETVIKMNKVITETFSNLTKAKEIIKQLLLLPYANNEEVFADVTSILDKAEQFLNEVEK